MYKKTRDVVTWNWSLNVAHILWMNYFHTDGRNLLNEFDFMQVEVYN